ncbi:MAG TPA: hypothetical protein VGF66_11480 [Gaiellaceae bacterium]|jgi:hypothetical protein
MTAVGPPRHLLARAVALVVVRLAWALVTIGVPLVAVIAALALLAAGR